MYNDLNFYPEKSVTIVNIESCQTKIDEKKTRNILLEFDEKKNEEVKMILQYKEQIK